MTEIPPLLSFIIGAKDRPDALIKCLNSILGQEYKNTEILVFDDNSKEDIAEAVKKQINDDRIIFMRSDVTCGVSGSRNRMIEKAKGDFLITLDDDSVFKDDDSLGKIVDLFNSYPDVALLSFKIRDIINQKKAGYRVPFTRAAVKRNPDIVNSPQYACYFIGCGHAIRKKVFEECGPYQDDLFFGCEESDLAYSFINSGHKIYYAPQVYIEHFPDNSTTVLQGIRKKYPYFFMRNRVWVNYKHLPWRHFIVNTVYWSGLRLLLSIPNKGVFYTLKGIFDGLVSMKKLKRTPLNKEAIAYLKANNGRLYR